MSEGGRWIRRRAEEAPGVRKILIAVGALRDIYVVSLISWVMAVIGIGLYTLVYPSSVILVEAFVWLIEAITFLGVAVSFRIASSRALFYRARFEIFRVEALSALIIAVVGIGVTGFIAYKSLYVESPSPIHLAAYPLSSSLVSLALERHLGRSLRAITVQVAYVNTVREKLELDVVLEAAGGIAIIVSNALSQPLAESLIVLVVGLYVAYGLASIAIKNISYVVGPGPASERERIRRAITREAMKLGIRVRSVRVESYGTFSEAEVWMEHSPESSLAEAQRKASQLSRVLVHNVPELLRAVVIPVPSARPVKRYKRREPLAPRERAKQS